MLITSAERFCPENVDKGGNEETNEFLKVSDVPKTIDTDSSKMHGTLGGGFINLESEKMVKL